ncbi:MAG: D-3-phosphoglycerate dehydrogenase, partial [uncultured Thermomicrobiales bacterium]
GRADQGRRLGQHRQHVARRPPLGELGARRPGGTPPGEPERRGGRPPPARPARRRRPRPPLVQQRRRPLRPVRPALRRLRRQPPLHPRCGRGHGRGHGRRLPGAPQGDAPRRSNRAGAESAADPAPRAGPPRRPGRSRQGPRHPRRRHPAGQLPDRRRDGLGLHPQLGQAPAHPADPHGRPRLRRRVAPLPGNRLPARPDPRPVGDGRDRPPGHPRRPRLRDAGPLLEPPSPAGVGSRLRHGTRRLGRALRHVRRPLAPDRPHPRDRGHRRRPRDRPDEARRPLRQHRPRQARRPGRPDRGRGHRPPRRRPRRLRRGATAPGRPAPGPPRRRRGAGHPDAPQRLGLPLDLGPRLAGAVAERPPLAGGRADPAPRL